MLCLAENAIGPDATRPDDVHVLYSQKYALCFVLILFVFSEVRVILCCACARVCVCVDVFMRA